MAEPWRAATRALTAFVARQVPPADVDDVVQAALLKALQGLPELRDAAQRDAWLRRIARNAVIDHFRARAAAARRIEAAGEDPTVGPASAGEAAGDDPAALLARCVPGFIQGLPAPYREALILTELEGLSQREAAARLGLSYSGLKSRVQRGRARLRAELEGCCRIHLDARQRVVGFTPRQGEGGAQ